MTMDGTHTNEHQNLTPTLQQIVLNADWNAWLNVVELNDDIKNPKEICHGTFYTC